MLGVPAELHVNRVIGFGYIDPSRAAAPKRVARVRKSLDELVHHDRW
jgi:hypothetical protein